MKRPLSSCERAVEIGGSRPEGLRLTRGYGILGRNAGSWEWSVHGTIALKGTVAHITWIGNVFFKSKQPKELRLPPTASIGWVGWCFGQDASKIEL